MSNAEQSSPSEGSPATTRLKQEIEQTRGDLSETVAALEEKLTPSQVREAVNAELQLVEDRVRDVLTDQLAEAKTIVAGEVREAAQFLREGLTDAERMFRSGLSDARESVREDVKNALTGARDSLRAATVGKVETFATNLGDSMNDARDTLLETVYDNPLPAVLTGVGLAWLLMNRSRSASSRSGGHGGNGNGHTRQHGRRGNEHLGEVVANAAHHATGSVAQGVHGAADAVGGALESASGMATAAVRSAQDGAQHAADSAWDGATAIAGTAQRSAKRVEQTLERQLRERPLAVGAAALAIGTMVGCALPHTRSEDEWMGETRDNVLGRAGDAVHEAASSVADLADGNARPDAGAKEHAAS